MKSEPHYCRNVPKLVLVAGLIAMVCFRLPNLSNPLIDHHDFRQTQTAITSYWLAHGSFDIFNYQTPLFGAQWTVPFEFPLYQAIVAAIHMVGVPLDLACRSVSVLLFSLAIFTTVVLLRTLRADSNLGIVFVLLCAVSPYAIVWSRACLIDFTCVLVSLLYVVQALSWAEGRSWFKTASLVAVGSLAACTKVTSFPVYWVPVSLIVANEALGMLRATSESTRRCIREWFIFAVKAVCVLILPILVAYLWTQHTDVLKTRSALAPHWLQSKDLAGWNYGSWAQRMKWSNWVQIWDRIRDLILLGTWPLILLGLYATPRYPAKLRLVLLGLSIGAVSTVFVFFNLYVVHDYYLCAIFIPIVLFAAVGVDSICSFRHDRAWIAGVIFLFISIPAAHSFTSDYVKASYTDYQNHELLVACQQVRDIVPKGDEIVVFGEDWNSRVPYYCQRKAIMADVVAPEKIREYTYTNNVRWIISRLQDNTRVSRMFGGIREVRKAGPYIVFQIITP